MKLYALVLSVFCILMTFPCKDVQEVPYVLPENAKELLTRNSEKTWKLAKRLNGGIRMNMGDCFLSYRITYKSDNTLTDNNGDHYDCGETLLATWKFFKNKEGYSFIKHQSEQLPKLMNIKENYKHFQVINLTDSTLTITFQHKQFSNKTMWITDYLVPEDVVVKGRNFHNK